MQNRILLAAFLLTIISTQAHNNLINSYRLNKNTITINPHDSFCADFLKVKSINFKYDTDCDFRGLDESIITLPFIACAAPYIWLSGHEYSVKNMDKDFYYALERIKAVFRLFYPQYAWSGAIYPNKLVNNVSQKKVDAVALLFSGGLDCVSASFSHQEKQLLITNHGVDIPLKEEKMWQNVRQQAKKFAQAYGHKNAFISFDFVTNVNYDKVIATYKITSKWWWLDNVVDALQHCAITAPLLILKGYKRLYIASSHTADFPYPYGSHPLIDNNIRFAGIAVCHDQGTLTRCDKIGFISSATQSIKKPKPHLRICWTDKEGNNCLNCEKCLRTFNNILAEGQVPQDYGFNVTVGDVMQRTKKFFVDKPIKDGRIVWEWYTIQRAMKKALAHAQLAKNHEVYFKWLCSLKLQDFYDKKIVYPESQKNYFGTLWNLGLHSAYS